jgi:hypothetical protein
MTNLKLLQLLESILGKGKSTSGDNIAFFSPFVSHYKPKLEINIKTTSAGENHWHCWISDKKGRSIASLFKQLNLPNSYGSFELLYNFMTTDLKRNNNLLKKIGSANALSDEEKQISFLNNYFVFKKVRNVINTDDALENSELKEKEQIAAISDEFGEIDKELELKQATAISAKSKKLAEKYLLENQDLENRMEKSLPDIIIEETKTKPQIKITIDEKIKLAEEKKKAKEEEKLKLAQEKKAAKELEKSQKAETKQSQKAETKKV